MSKYHYYYYATQSTQKKLKHSEFVHWDPWYGALDHRRSSMWALSISRNFSPDRILGWWKNCTRLMTDVIVNSKVQILWLQLCLICLSPSSISKINYIYIYSIYVCYIFQMILWRNAYIWVTGCGLCDTRPEPI